MEINKLQGFVLLLVLIGMIMGVGVLTLDKYSRAVRTTTTITDANVNVSSGAATLTQTYCLAFSTIQNATGATTWVAGDYVSFSDADTCAITSTLPTDMLYNITYTYGAATAATTATNNVNSAITPISSTWLPLIVTVAVLAIILGLVISSFAMKGKR